MMCKPTEKPLVVDAKRVNIQTRQVIYAITSFALGAWAFVKVNQISGPAFEPILAACTNPDISVDEFAEKTGLVDFYLFACFKYFLPFRTLTH